MVFSTWRFEGAVQEMGESEPESTQADGPRYRKAVVSIVLYVVLSLLLVNVAGFCIPLIPGCGFTDGEWSMAQSHVALSWIQVIPLLCWIAITRASWIATSGLVRGSNNVVIVLAWVLRSVVFVHTAATASNFLVRVIQPLEFHALTGMARSLSGVGFWVVCLVTLMGVFGARGFWKHVGLAAFLLGYYLGCGLAIEPLLAVFSETLSGPFRMHLEILMSVLATLVLYGLFGVAIAKLALVSVPFLGPPASGNCRGS